MLGGLQPWHKIKSTVDILKSARKKSYGETSYPAPIGRDLRRRI
jgi:hypothetical protein